MQMNLNAMILEASIMTHSAGPCYKTMSCRGQNLHQHIDSFLKKQALTTRSATLDTEHLPFLFRLLLSVNSGEFMKYLYNV